ncbi:hypothetical protein PENSPDRAFT_650703 [Peniophora sp. CONT]|nr:hypothetical protein PENSPDRAFT_650703 [Peniophora sp. CONT]
MSRFAPKIPHIQELPHELLVEIFRFFTPRKVVDWIYGYTTWSTSLDEPRALSQVCSTWRTIALDVKSLWTGIPVVNEFWAEISLERSRPLPVVISITLNESADFQAGIVHKSSLGLYDLHDGVRMALSQSHRIRILQIEVLVYDSSQLVWLTHKMTTFLARGSMPLLEEAEIDINQNALYRPCPSFLGESTPHGLHHLSLRGIDESYLPCPHLFAAPLTSLVLGYGTIWEFVEDALLALSLIPSLEILEIKRDRDGDSDQPSAISEFDIFELTLNARSVALPNLKLLDLHETLELVACMMKFLAFPTTARIHLYALCTADEGDVVRGFVDIIATSLSLHYVSLINEDRPFRGLFLDMECSHEQHRLLLAADHSLHQVPSTPRTCLIPKNERYNIFHSDQLPFTLSLCGHSSFSGIELVENFVRLPIFSQAYALTFTESQYGGPNTDPFLHTSSSDWKRIMLQFDHLSVIQLHSYAAVHVLQALAEGRVGESAFDAIVDITISEVAFIHMSPNDTSGRPAYVPFDALYAILNQSIGDGGKRPLVSPRRVNLAHCDVDEEQVAQLRRSFGGELITWDGTERGSYESTHRFGTMSEADVAESIAFLENKRRERASRAV